MQHSPKPAQHSESAKKPYQAPELVVMGDAAEMTQLGGGVSTDGLTSPTTAAS